MYEEKYILGVTILFTYIFINTHTVSIGNDCQR